MNPKLLVDAIVQQTTVLIAQLSTTAGVRAPLAHLADQVFVELAREIERQGVSKKVAADMFGLALRTYQLKVRRLEESVTSQGTTLWEAVLRKIEEEPSIDRRALLASFPKDDPQSLGAVLKDLSDGGLIYRTGSGAAARFRAVPEEEREAVLRAHDRQALVALVRVAIYRGASSNADLARRLGSAPEAIEGALSELIAEGLVRRGPDGSLSTQGVVIPTGSQVGWEAAVFDHYQAMVTAITRKLADGGARSAEADTRGGATVSFELSAEHPLRAEVHGLLKTVRAQVNDLWQRVGEHNRAASQALTAEEGKAWLGQMNRAQRGGPTTISAADDITQTHVTSGGAPPPSEVVTFYFGQSIKESNGP